MLIKSNSDNNIPLTNQYKIKKKKPSWKASARRWCGSSKKKNWLLKKETALPATCMEVSGRIHCRQLNKSSDKPIAHPPSTPPTHRRARFFFPAQYESDQIWIKHKMPVACFSCIDFKLCQWMYQGTLSGVAALRYMVLCTQYKPWSLVHLFSSHSLKIRPNSLAFTSVRLLTKWESVFQAALCGCKSDMTLTVDLVQIFDVFSALQNIIHCFATTSVAHDAKQLEHLVTVGQLIASAMSAFIVGILPIMPCLACIFFWPSQTKGSVFIFPWLRQPSE